MDPVHRKMTHIAFVRVIMDEVIGTTVPVDVNGTAIGVKEGGLLDFQVRDLHIECLPNAIPDVINVDISNLGLHQYVRISELGLPQGVKVLDDPDRVVVGVTHQKAEVVETPEVVAGVEAVPAEPEVIARGKKPEEEPAE